MLAKYFAPLSFVALVVVAIVGIVWSSLDFQQCIKGNRQHNPGNQHLEKSVSIFVLDIPTYRHCIGDYVTKKNAIITALGTVIIAIFTTILGIFTITLSRATRTAAEAAKQSADGLLDAERPHMVVSDIKISGLKNPIDAYGHIELLIWVKVMNYGRSPALLRSRHNAVIIGTELNPIPQDAILSPVRFIIAPNHWYGTIEPNPISTPGTVANKIINGEYLLWDIIVLEYEDSFKRPHKMRAAFRVTFTAGGSSGHFYPDGPDSYWEYT